MTTNDFTDPERTTAALADPPPTLAEGELPSGLAEGELPDDELAEALVAGTPAAALEASAHPYPRRWIALGVLAIAQLMVVLDATVVNIALPTAQKDLGISDADRQWVVTAYTLTFGGLLLLGGRIADYWGRRRTFIAGAIGFAAASAIGGLAQSGGMLFGARGLQGAFGAMLTPAGLSLMTVMFTEARERAKAFAVYGAIAGGGSAIGLLLGGILTEYATWRWCLLVNIPVAIVAVILAIAFLPESHLTGKAKYDVPGAVTATLGLISLVYGLTQAAQKDIGWGHVGSLGYIGAGVILLIAFVLIERKVRHPLLPLHIILNRNRGGAYLTALCVGAGMFGSFLFMTIYFQNVLLYKPLEAGLAALPVTFGVLCAATIASQLVPKLGPKPLMVAGGIIAACGMFYLTRIGVDTAFLTHVMPAQLLLGLGMGLTFVPLSSLALVGVPEHDAGAASATLNATQQIGGSIGVAVLNTVYISAFDKYLAANGPDSVPSAIVNGTQLVFWLGGGLLLLGSLFAFLLITVKRGEHAHAPATESVVGMV